MDPRLDRAHLTTRRHFLQKSQAGLGALALGDLLGRTSQAAPRPQFDQPLASKAPHHKPRAKNIIYLDMSGAPPTLDLFDYKPELVKHHMQPCPDSLIKGQRFAFIKGVPKLLGTPYKFKKCGEAGTSISEVLPHLQTVADDIAVIRSMHTDQFNHAPAELFMYTGTPRFGGASMGAWITWGLGSENQDLPGFVVLVSSGTDPSGGKSLWGSGYLPSVFQGVQCRTKGEPILYVNDPPGMDRQGRRRSLDALRELNELEWQQTGDPETQSRISQYELAFRMQTAVPEVMDISREPKHIQELYGAKPGAPSFANNCLLARRLVEQGVRYVQLFDWGWDFHGISKDSDIVQGLPDKCREIDRPVTALIKDLKQRGMLDDTLVLWGGEFGRTPMNEERNGSKFLGRDHHPHCFSMWMAGGGIKGGTNYGATDDLGYFITEGKIGVHDLQATILHLLGLNPHRLSYPFQGLDQRLIGPTNDARICREILA
jgi:hypothetical protein